MSNGFYFGMGGVPSKCIGAIDAGLDKDIIADCLEELRVLWKEREEEEAA